MGELYLWLLTLMSKRRKKGAHSWICQQTLSEHLDGDRCQQPGGGGLELGDGQEGSRNSECKSVWRTSGCRSGP